MEHYWNISIYAIFQITLLQLSSSFRIETKPDAEAICRPPGKTGVTQYVIGYGSLMSTDSKFRTYPNTSENLPVDVKGYKRVWNCKGVSPSLSTTYLGATKDPSSHFNGVIFSLDNGETGLKDYDKRESFYCRKEVPFKDIQLLSSGSRSPTDSKFIINKSRNISENSTTTTPTETTEKSSDLAEGQYWIYVTKPEFSEFPSRKFPIVQSYVDTWLTGCLELEDKFALKGFAEQCVQTTDEWSNFWENDRIYPRRPFFYTPKAIAIDKLLGELRPKEFSSILNSNNSLAHHFTPVFKLILSTCIITLCYTF